jgi:hypothetical protein
LVALGLLKKICERTDNAQSSVKLVHVPRQQNTKADALARDAAGEVASNQHRALHYPAMDSFFDGNMVIIDGRFVVQESVKVAHNFMTAGHTPHCLIDAGYLREVYGEKYLMEIESTTTMAEDADEEWTFVLHGKVDMTVLGKTRIKLSLGYGTMVIDDALVVDFLPWPVQISKDHPACTNSKVFGPTALGQSITCGYPRDWRDLVPPRYRNHPYWTASV